MEQRIKNKKRKGSTKMEEIVRFFEDIGLGNAESRQRFKEFDSKDIQDSQKYEIRFSNNTKLIKHGKLG